MSETTEEELHVRPSGPCDAQRAVPQAEPVPTGRSGQLGRFDAARPGRGRRSRGGTVCSHTPPVRTPGLGGPGAGSREGCGQGQQRD